MLIVDAHLDLAYNIARGRDPRERASQQPIIEDEIATVGLPDLRDGNVGLICATIFCLPAKPNDPASGYTTAEQAREQALSQLRDYQSWEQQNLVRFVRSADELPTDIESKLPAILLMEGADAIRSPDDLAEWHDAGLRMIALSWQRTRFAGGTGAPGPLTDEGRALVTAMDRLRMIHDTSHLAEESFWELLDHTSGPIVATHSNCRAIIGGGDRHLSDEMIRAIAKRGGIIGINFFDKFLVPQNEYGKRRATLHDVVRHIEHICTLVGDTNHIGLGTDMDGGLGREQIPQEISTSADLPRVADALRDVGWSDADAEKFAGKNWLDFFARNLH